MIDLKIDALLEAIRKWKTAKKSVQDWMEAEGKATRFRQNHQAPGWYDYQDAERILWERIMEVD